MALSVQYNSSASSASRQLRQHSNKLSTSFERLSSGLRINGAKDDAAGLSISTRMEAQVRSMNRRVANANDALSFAQTAESVLAEGTNHLQRMRELALQASNAPLSTSDREAIQKEIEQLKAELTANGGLTFNQKKLFNQGHSFFISEEKGQTLDVRLGPTGAKDLGKLVRVTSATTVDVSRELADGEFTIINDGVSTTIRASNAADDQLSSTQNANSAIAKAAAINAASERTGVIALVEETVTGSSNVDASTLNESNYIVLNGEVITGISVMQNDTDGSLKSAINQVAETTGVIATQNELGQLILTAKDGRNIDIDVVGTVSLAGFSDMTIGGKITLQAHDLFEVDMQGKANISLGNIARETFDNGSSSASVDSYGKVSFAGVYDSSLQNDFSFFGGLIDISGTVATTGNYILYANLATASTNLINQISIGKEGALGAPLQTLTYTGDGVYSFNSFEGNNIDITLTNTASFDISTTAGSDDQVDGLSFSLKSIGPVQFGGGGAVMGNTPVSVDTIDVTTQDGAVDALYVIDFAIEQLSESRAELGAVQNRLNSTINNLQASSESTSIAASRIRDADFAVETAELSRTQIIQQASVSVLAQANQAPQVALALLG